MPRSIVTKIILTHGRVYVSRHGCVMARYNTDEIMIGSVKKVDRKWTGYRIQGAFGRPDVYGPYPKRSMAVDAVVYAAKKNV